MRLIFCIFTNADIVGSIAKIGEVRVVVGIPGLHRHLYRAEFLFLHQLQVLVDKSRITLSGLLLKRIHLYRLIQLHLLKIEHRLRQLELLGVHVHHIVVLLSLLYPDPVHIIRIALISALRTRMVFVVGIRAATTGVGRCVAATGPSKCLKLRQGGQQVQELEEIELFPT